PPATINDQRAHMRRGLGVTMKLHSGSPLGQNGTCGNAHSFRGIPSEQPTWKSQLGKGERDERIRNGRGESTAAARGDGHELAARLEPPVGDGRRVAARGQVSAPEL